MPREFYNLNLDIHTRYGVLRATCVRVLKYWITQHARLIYNWAMINGYLYLLMFFLSARFFFTAELRIYLLTSWRGIQQFNEKHGQNEKEFECLRGINVSSTLDRNELIFHRASKRRCIDAEKSERPAKTRSRRILQMKLHYAKTEDAPQATGVGTRCGACIHKVR